MRLEEGARVVAPLPDALAGVAEPRAALLDDAELAREIEDVARAADALPVEDVEFDLAERRRHLVLHHLHARSIAHHDRVLLVERRGLFDRADATDVEAHRRVELERVAARRRLGAAEHDADLHADLVDEDDEAVRARDRAGELAERLAHQACLEPDVVVAHVALDFGLRHERGDRVDHDHVDRPRANEHVGDLERLLAVVGLREEELVGLDSELLRVGHVHRVLGVDVRRDAAGALDRRDRVERERRLAARLRAVDFDDAAARVAANAEREIEAQRPRRHRRDALVELLAVLEAHDRALAVLFLDACDGELESLRSVLVIHGAVLRVTVVGRAPGRDPP